MNPWPFLLGCIGMFVAAIIVKDPQAARLYFACGWLCLVFWCSISLEK